MQAADKLISGGIQVPISPSYSPCDLRQMVSFLRSCFLICPWKIMWWEPRVTVKIWWHNVCRSAVSPRRCLFVKGGIHVCIPGWSCWALLWSRTSRLILYRCCSGSRKRQEVGSESQRNQMRLRLLWPGRPTGTWQDLEQGGSLRRSSAGWDASFAMALDF